MNLLQKDDPAWVERYRPQKVKDTILPTKIKTQFQSYVDKGVIPTSLLLSGGPGMGKTTVAKAVLEELDCDYIVVNGSKDGNIDVLRNKIQNFASSVSLSGGRKYVIIDEADYLNPQSTQPALRNFMETYSKNCGFIMTANYPQRLIKELRSRQGEIKFEIPKDEFEAIAVAAVKRISEILTKEKIPFDKKVVPLVVQKFFPDLRKTLIELQKYAQTGAIDSGILTNFSEIDIKTIVKLLKSKDFTKLRQWIGEHPNLDSVSFFRKFYDTAAEHFTLVGQVQLIRLIGNYQDKASRVADQEINLMAFLVELMVEGEFK